MTRDDLKHFVKMPDARKQLNRSVREERIESRDSTQNLEGMESRTQYVVKSIMHFLTVDYDTFSNKEKVAVVVPVTSIEVEATGFKTMLPPFFSI